MKTAVFWTGIAVLILSIILGILAGAVFPGNATVPVIYGSNQVAYVFTAIIGIVIAVAGAALGKKSTVQDR